MEEFILFPQPYGVVLAAFGVAFLLCRKPDKFYQLERKLHLQKLRVVSIMLLLFLPLMFAEWDETDILIFARQICGYMIVVIIGFFFGIMSIPEEKKPQE